jgi:hypothetical protein
VKSEFRPHVKPLIQIRQKTLGRPAAARSDKEHHTPTAHFVKKSFLNLISVECMPVFCRAPTPPRSENHAFTAGLMAAIMEVLWNRRFYSIAT